MAGVDVLDADREYVLRRLREAREIEQDARLIRYELEAAIGPVDAPRGADLLRWAEFCEARREQLRHIDVELYLVAARPPPLWLWLPIWIQPPDWYEHTPWRTLGALWCRVRDRVRGFG